MALKTKILLTGSNGLVGQKIAELSLNFEDIELILCSYSDNKISHLPFKFVALDITNYTAVNGVIEQEKPDVIINCAGISQVDDCEENPSFCWDVNVNAVDNLVQQCKKNSIRFIQFSTDFVFDGTKGMYTETDSPSPVSVYGNSNLEAEKLVIKELNDYAIVRTVLVYGVTASMSRSNLVLWVKESLENNKAIKVVDDQFRTPTLAEDLAQGTLDLALSNKNGVFHLSGNEYVSVYEFALKVANYFMLDKSLLSPISSLSLKQKGKRPPKTGFDISKAIRELNYMPGSLNKGLEMVENQLKQIES